MDHGHDVGAAGVNSGKVIGCLHKGIVDQDLSARCRVITPHCSIRIEIDRVDDFEHRPGTVFNPVIHENSIGSIYNVERMHETEIAIRIGRRERTQIAIPRRGDTVVLDENVLTVPGHADCRGPVRDAHFLLRHGDFFGSVVLGKQLGIF